MERGFQKNTLVARSREQMSDWTSLPSCLQVAGRKSAACPLKEKVPASHVVVHNISCILAANRTDSQWLRTTRPAISVACFSPVDIAVDSARERLHRRRYKNRIRLLARSLSTSATKP